MEILDLVRKEAKRRTPGERLRRAAASAAGDWAAVESALLQDLLADPGRAERVAAAFLRVAAAADSREGRARAARLQGSWLAYVGRFEESLEPYETAAGLLSGASRDGARLGIAGSLLRLGRFDEAIGLCRRIRTAAQKRGDTAIAAGADLNRAVALHESGRPEKAVPLYESAGEALAAAGHAQMAATAVQNAANALVLLDRYEEAAPRYESAAAAFEDSGAANEAARCRYNRGALLVATDRLGEADAALLACEEEFRRLGDRVHAALCRLDRGEALLRAGLLPEARAALTTARRRLVRGAPPVERARAALLLTRALILEGETASARRMLARPLPLPESTAADRTELLGLADAEVGRHTAARRRLLDAAAKYGSRRPVAAARSRLAAAACALDAGDPGAAGRILKTARRGVAAAPLPRLRFAEAALSFLVEDRAGRRAAAEAELERSLGDLADVRAGLGNDAFRAALLRGKERWLARAVRHRLEENADRALEMLEEWRSRALTDLLGEVDRVAPRDERIAALRARVTALESRLEGDLAPGFLRSPETVDHPALVRDLASAERDLAEALRHEVPVVAPVPPEVVGHRLPRGTVVLSLHSDESGTLLFVTRRAGTEVFASAVTLEEVAALTDELHFVLGQFTVGEEFALRHRDRLERRIRRPLDELSRVALAPAIRAVRKADHLIVVPHGPWQRVPFAALPIGQSPLVKTCSVGLSPSLAALDKPPRRARGRSVVLSFSDRAAPLIEAEGRDVAAHLDGSELFEGRDAVVERLVGRSPPECLHIAAHGSYRADAPGMGGVRLADGWLRAVDLAGLPLRGSLVVLSGCRTGVTTAREGDEVEGLVRGAYAAGASELVASLWRVDDATTAELFRRFYRERRRGRSTAKSLAAAQRSMADRGAHPFYWAGFTAWSRRPDPRT
jgi:tetratricopeptide (TPR) repeat protein